MCYYNLEQTEMAINSGYGPLLVPKMFRKTNISHHLIRTWYSLQKILYKY